MEKKKKLPEIIITGTIQELVEIETLLVMAGYDQNDKTIDSINNNRVIAGNVVGIKCYDDGFYVYRTNAIIDVYDKRNLRASEIHKILHYIETGEIKEYCEDMQMVCHGPIMRKTHTHTGQTKVVGKRVGDKPYTLKDLMENRITATSPINPKYHLRDWNKIEREFKEWANPDKNNCIAYYSPTSQEEILMFFKKYFIK